MGCGAIPARQEPQDAASKSSASAPRGSASETATTPGVSQPPPCLRLLVSEKRAWQLNTAIANRAILKDKAAEFPPRLPENSNVAGCWFLADCMIVEMADGLVMTIDTHGCKGAHCLATWNGSPENNQLCVAALKPVNLTGRLRAPGKHWPRPHGEHHEEVQDDCEIKVGEVEVIDIPEEHRELPSVFYPLLLRWVEGKEKCMVLGFEDQGVCERWATNLGQYCNLGRRFLVDSMWKLNHTVCEMLTFMEDAGYTESDLPAELQDISNWRHRLTFLQQQKEPESLALAYVSEKDDANTDIVCILASASEGSKRAKVSQLPLITLGEMSPHSADHAKMSAQQYLLATGLADPRVSTLQHEPPLPRCLNALHIQWQALQEDGTEHLMHAVFACEDHETCATWMATIAKQSDLLLRPTTDS